jgi:hypothetical protein
MGKATPEPFGETGQENEGFGRWLKALALVFVFWTRIASGALAAAEPLMR